VKHEFTVEFSPEALKPYSGPDVNQKFAGEDDLIWCERCKCNHRRGAGWEIEQERMIQKMARKIAAKIDAEVSNAVR
jgi:hypothetical protein